MSCPFCDSEVIKNQTLYESKKVRVILNIYPANKGQCLVVPKRHVTSIRGLSKEELVDLIVTVKKVSSEYVKHRVAADFNYGFNEGEYAGQTVDHFHLIPRLKGDVGDLPEYHVFHRAPETKRKLTTEEIKPIVAELRKVLS